MMKIAECSGIVKAAVKKMRPVLTFLFRIYPMTILPIIT